MEIALALLLNLAGDRGVKRNRIQVDLGRATFHLGGSDLFSSRGALLAFLPSLSSSRRLSQERILVSRIVQKAFPLFRHFGKAAVL
jgi:hypothetical protein